MGFPLPSTDPLGTDIVLDSNGDLAIDTSGSFQTLSNNENVQQALRILLATAPNTYYWDDNVGSNLVNYVNEPITSQLEQEITSLVTEKALEDSRIIEVTQVLIDDSNQDALIIFVSATVSGVGNVQIPITVTGGA